MRKLIYHVASTLDNYIAREDGTTDGFLEEGAHVSEYIESLQGYDTVIMGRRTYEYGYAFGLQPGARAYPHMRHYIFSKTIHLQNPQGIEIVKEREIERVQQLKQEEGTPIYLCGGGAFAGFLFDHGLIDELILKLNPVVFGSGIKLFGDSVKKAALTVCDAKTYANSVILIRYRINDDTMHTNG